ncbi:MFS transporter [Entomohabitans teleogrylli]|uniref:MFS transporter n=1 Tax=Entomohabitans teleogrylli TaxID=1384589 RepID=UPI00073D2FB0|nr:MFS transporter [Entomohabitans teleogrylli]
MTARTAWQTLYLFPAALILYEFAAYLTNDMIQPGILYVVRDFNADPSLAPASISLYMAGGMVLQWLLGPLSDRIGRRPVLIAGAAIFTLACLATLATQTMTQFLIARFIQGTSMCFIATVGYVTVQEAFSETTAIRMMSIIISITLVAPIIGPLLGAVFLHLAHWKMMFGAIAVMSALGGIGLLLYMPETVQQRGQRFSLSAIWRDFRSIIANPVFLSGTLTITAIYIPLMSWVAISPLVLMQDRGLSSTGYAWSQVPVFGCVIVGNLLSGYLAGKNAHHKVLRRSAPLLVAAGPLALALDHLLSGGWPGPVAGMSLFALSVGLMFPVLFRLTLFSDSAPKGTVSATLNIILLALMALGIELARWLWQQWGSDTFHLMTLACAGLSIIALRVFIQRRERVEN